MCFTFLHTGRGGGGCTRYSCMTIIEIRPTHLFYYAGTEQVGFSPTRQTLLAPSSKRREVFGESHDGWTLSMLTSLHVSVGWSPYLDILEDFLRAWVELLRVVVDLGNVLRVFHGTVQILVELPADVRHEPHGTPVHLLPRLRCYLKTVSVSAAAKTAEGNKARGGGYSCNAWLYP